MYNYKDIRTIHLEITSKCQASCPMCARNIQGGIDNPFMTLAEISLEQFKEWFPVEFIQQLDRLYMCGNLGDPIIAKDTLSIFQYLRDNNSKIQLSMNTNGSAQKKKFWQQLASLGITIRFGIDGLADKHSLYRIGTDWNKIIDNAKSFIDHGGYAVWDMLVFEHNKHQVEDCRSLSHQLGFKEFYSKNTARFRDNQLHVLDRRGKTVHILHPTERSKNIVTAPESKNISCKVAKEKNLYVSATGIVTPCCWLELSSIPPHNPNRVDYMDKVGVYPNLKEYKLKEIFDSGYFDVISQTWACDPLKECAKQCGQVDRFNEQYR